MQYRLENLDGKIKLNRSKECAVAALALGAEIPYEQAQEMVFRKDQDHFGFTIAKELGWRWISCSNMTLADVLPSGRLIVLFRHPWHFQAIVDGVAVGPWDITRCKGKLQNLSTWRIQGYFTKQ